MTLQYSIPDTFSYGLNLPNSDRGSWAPKKSRKLRVEVREIKFEYEQVSRLSDIAYTVFISDDGI
jgi:hypothetical protein